MDARGIRLLAAVLACVIATACGGGSSSGTSASAAAAGRDSLETGLQGQVPLADQQSGRAALGYRKGLGLVGQNTILDRGNNFSLAWLDDCAYVTTASGQQIFGTSSSPYVDPQFAPLNGMAVIDASDPTHPTLLKILQSPAMVAPHESLHANAERHIIVGTRSGGMAFDVFDARDCRNPIFKSTIQVGFGVTLPPLPGLGTAEFGLPFFGHAMCITDDGRTAYATSSAQTNAIIDLDDLSNPKVIQLFAPAAHDCGLNPDGTRLYLAIFGFVSLGVGLPNGPSLGQNGLMILDVSAIQNRTVAPSPVFFGPAPPQVGFLGWSNVAEGESPNAGSHTARWFRSKGRSYVFSSDEWPTAGFCPWAHARIIDITDETHPVKVSDLRLEVQNPAHCATTIPDSANYSSHYVGFDNVDDATTVFTTNYSSGLRVWDIHDVANPKEIAYWHPIPNAHTPEALGNQFALSSGALWDAVGNYPRYRPGLGHIWIVGVSSGFQILAFTPTAGPTAPK